MINDHPLREALRGVLVAAVQSWPVLRVGSTRSSLGCARRVPTIDQLPHQVAGEGPCEVELRFERRHHSGNTRAGHTARSRRVLSARRLLLPHVVC